MILNRRNSYWLMMSVVILAGCKKQEIVYYEIPKETVQSVTPELPSGHPDISGGGMSSGMGSLPGFDKGTVQTELSWGCPEGWFPSDGSSVRLASFRADGADKTEFDMSITRFPGDVGGMFSNVNRWRGQLGLEHYSDPAQVAAAAEVFKTSNFEFHIFKMHNDAEPPMATEVAILDLNGFSWFFKMTGAQSRIESESLRFRTFLESVKSASTGE